MQDPIPYGSHNKLNLNVKTQMMKSKRKEKMCSMLTLTMNTGVTMLKWRSTFQNKEYSKIKESNFIRIQHIYASNNRASKNMKLKLIELQGKIHKYENKVKDCKQLIREINS